MTARIIFNCIVESHGQNTRVIIVGMKTADGGCTIEVVEKELELLGKPVACIDYERLKIEL